MTTIVTYTEGTHSRRSKDDGGKNIFKNHRRSSDESRVATSQVTVSSTRKLWSTSMNTGAICQAAERESFECSKNQTTSKACFLN